MYEEHKCGICGKPSFYDGELREGYRSLFVRWVCPDHMNEVNNALEDIRKQQAPELKAYIKELRKQHRRSRVVKKFRAGRVKAVKAFIKKHRTLFIAIPPYLALAAIVTYKLLF